VSTFYLGVPEPRWLEREEFRGVPLFVSHNRLRRVKNLPRAITRWALDSGGFNHIETHGRWTITAAEYAEAVDRYHREIGMMDWAAPQDWMCEAKMLARTGLTVDDHQRLTTENGLELRRIAPHLPWIWVLQGDTPASYLAHVALYAEHGVDLTAEAVVGVGSVCRRQSTAEATEIFQLLAGLGINVHGFGVKILGRNRYADALVSADSQAWSARARNRGRAGKNGEPPQGALPGCTHRNCNYCPKFALQWREAVLAGRPTP